MVPRLRDIEGKEHFFVFGRGKERMDIMKCIEDILNRDLKDIHRQAVSKRKTGQDDSK